MIINAKTIELSHYCTIENQRNGLRFTRKKFKNLYFTEFVKFNGIGFLIPMIAFARHFP